MWCYLGPYPKQAVCSREIDVCCMEMFMPRQAGSEAGRQRGRLDEHPPRSLVGSV